MKNILAGIAFILFAMLCLKICEMGVYLGFDLFYLVLLFGIVGIILVIIEVFKNEKTKD